MHALLDLLRALREECVRSNSSPSDARLGIRMNSEEWWYAKCSNASPPTLDDARKSEQHEPELFFANRSRQRSRATLLGVHISIRPLKLSDFYIGSSEDDCFLPELLDKICECPQQYVQIYQVLLLIHAVAGPFGEPLMVRSHFSCTFIALSFRSIVRNCILRKFDDYDCCKTSANVRDKIKKLGLEIAHATEMAILS